MKNIKYVLLIPFLAAIILPNFVSAMTAEEIQALISRLQAQIVQLQEQLTQTQTAVPQWCHNFDTNLTVGMAGSEVKALHLALEKESFSVSAEEKNNANFDESTASAVSGFQAKYKDEILTPLGLQYGTGFVGKASRVKLNKLYGCGIVSVPTPSPSPKLEVCAQVITPAKNPLTGECKDFSNPCSVPSGWEKVSSCSATACGMLVCQVGQTLSDTGGKDSRGCPIKKCIPTIIDTGTGVHRFEILDSNGCPPCLVGTVCAACPLKSTYTIYNAKISVSDEKGNYVGARDTSGGMAVFENLIYGNYTATISAEGYEADKSSFTVCATCGENTALFLKKTSALIKSITILSPNGGEKWQKGSTQTIKWNSSNVSQIYIKLRKGSDTYSGSEGVVSNIISNNGSFQWNIPKTLPDGSDYAIRLVEATGAVLDDSDASFSIVSAGLVSFNAPEMVYPVDGQNLTYGYPHGYMFKVKPVAGASGYLFGFFQNGVMIYENWRDDKKLSIDGEFAVWPDNLFYSKLQEGDLQVWIRALISGQWSEARIITVKLVSPITVTPSITVISPNGGEQWLIGNTYTVKWQIAGAIRGVHFELYKGGVLFAGLGGMSPAPTSFSWDTINTSDLIPGADYKIRIRSSDDPTIYDESDNFFSISSLTPSPTTCTDLKSNSANNYYFDLCNKGGFDRICFNKYYSTYQGCGKSILYDDCTVQNANADKNIRCDTGLVYTCADSDNGKDYYKQGTVTDSGKTYTDYCVDSSVLKEYFCSISDSNPTGIISEENYTCSSGCENNACKAQVKPTTLIPETSAIKDIENQLANISRAFLKLLEEAKYLLGR